MDGNNFVDTSQGMMYNTSKNDVYAAVADHYAQTQVVKMDEQKPINETTCRHENLVPDPDDRIGDAVFHGCTTPKCGVGFYIQI